VVKVRRGDVRWATIGGRRRPVVVITRDTAIGLLSTITVAPATRTIRGIPSEVPLSKADGMPADCVISLDNLELVPKSGLRGRITTLSPARLEELCDALRYAVGC
jgi:mRNA interferase MazF